MLSAGIQPVDSALSVAQLELAAVGFIGFMALFHTGTWVHRRRLVTATARLLAPRSGRHARPRESARFWD
ncbi:hypothetical protein GCM10027589_15450 [Actinocorallia lasiicapitis]